MTRLTIWLIVGFALVIGVLIISTLISDQSLLQTRASRGIGTATKYEQFAQ